VIYDVSHRTTFEYSQSVSISHHLLHLSPRPCPNQVCNRHSLMIEPSPAISKDSRDYFGNPTRYLTIEAPHSELSIVARSNIEVTAPVYPDPAETPAWDGIPDLLKETTERNLLDVYQFAFDSPFTQSGNGIAAYGAQSFPPGRPILEGAIDLMNRIYGEFKYEGGVTDVYTPVDKVLANKHGVCQDFAHLQISCLRSMGIPARYVSGYLQTIPPEGQERMVGADASHAWLSVWVPEAGWVDLDPTNNVMPGDQHITVAWGRDYGDVSPINGLVLGGGHHEIEVAVDVVAVGG
jgi:transglutaminase-like putative cysteine protease